jgi:predicted aspartyl protease
VPRSPVPGEAQLDPTWLSQIALVNNVTLGTLTTEHHLDAMIDTGATDCIVPPSIARVLGFHSGNRIRRQRTNTLGSQVEMDLHRLHYLRVGSAKAWNVRFGVHTTMQGSRWMIVGLSFMRQFRTTFEFDARRVLFRSITPPGSAG